MLIEQTRVWRKWHARFIRRRCCLDHRRRECTRNLCASRRKKRERVRKREVERKREREKTFYHSRHAWYLFNGSFCARKKGSWARLIATLRDEVDWSRQIYPVHNWSSSCDSEVGRYLTQICATCCVSGVHCFRKLAAINVDRISTGISNFFVHRCARTRPHLTRISLYFEK